MLSILQRPKRSDKGKNQQTINKAEKLAGGLRCLLEDRDGVHFKTLSVIQMCSVPATALLLWYCENHKPRSSEVYNTVKDTEKKAISQPTNKCLCG